MTSYEPPLRDIHFVLEHQVDLEALAKLPAFAHADPATVAGVVEEAGRFMAEVIGPTNRQGDLEGARREADGSVTTPQGFVEAYRLLVAAGWTSVGFDIDFGGGGFPWVVALALQEMLTSANMSLSLCPMLTQSAVEMLATHGTEAQQERYLHKLVSGEWTGTMNLTEPEAGSDVGALRARAVPNDDGTYRITGTKIYISYGEHDLAENIVHLVLARTPGAAPGTRGISCFIVPKFLVGDDGSVGERNGIRCMSIEHKLGIKASPTCVLSYEDAVGELIGPEHGGMRAMFTMMNNARLAVGVEGLGLADRAYQQARSFALERRQGRAVGADPATQSLIVEHPDVRRMLLTMKAQIEAVRALLYLNAEAIDVARQGADDITRQRAQERVELLTPVSKAWSTDLGVQVTSLAIQVHGGMGYIEETGVAQHFRDARIPPIYEGTNGIQAIDLATRKLPARDGGVVRDHLADMAAVLPELEGGGAGLSALHDPLAAALGALGEATEWLLAHRAGDPRDVLAGATPYLELFGLVTGGWLLARQAVAADRLRSGGGNGADPAFLDAKVATARFYAEQLLPAASGLVGAVTAGADDLFSVPVDQL